MKIESIYIEGVVRIVKSSGNDIADISEGWSKVKQVVYMKNKLSNVDRDKIAQEEPSLHHWVSEKTPHNPAEEGYMCDTYNVGITFPR